MTIEEAKNSDAEDESQQSKTPKHNNNSLGRVRLNNTLTGAGEAPGSRREQSNGLGGLIKKIRGGSNPPESESLESSGFLKKQTPISERNNESGKPIGIMLGGKPMYNNPPPGFSSVREQNRFEGTITPHENGYSSLNQGAYSSGIGSLGSPGDGATR